MFQFNPNNTDQSLELDIARQESDHAEEELLETEVIAAENEVHEGVSKDAKRQLQSSFEKLSDLESRQENGKLTPEEADQNILNITRSRIQNIIIRERLRQANGPASLTRNKLLDDIRGCEWSNLNFDYSFVKQHIDGDLWAGIQSATRSAELALKNHSFDEQALNSLENKQILFNDQIDANDATDYILIGTNPTEAGGSPEHIAVLVQVGTSANYKDFKKVRDDHEKLGGQLVNRVSAPQNKDQIIEERGPKLCADIINDVDMDLQEGVSIESFKKLSNQIRVQLQGVLNMNTWNAIGESDPVGDLSNIISDQERIKFAHSLYTLNGLAESKIIAQVVDSVFKNLDDFGHKFLSQETKENKNKIKEATNNVIRGLASFVQNKLDLPTPKKTSYKLYSHIDLKYADGDTLPRGERTQELSVDDPISAVYSVDSEAFDAVLEQIIAHYG
jgi:hypothetical protein